MDLDKVIAKLNTEVQKIEGRTLKGLIRAAVIVRRDMDKVSPKIPVYFNNLRSSFYMVTSEGKVEQGLTPIFKRESGRKKDKRKLSAKAYNKLIQDHPRAINKAVTSSGPVKDGPYVIMGFSAFYSIYVHEMPVSYTFNRKGSGPKFLENALDRNILEILYKVAKEVKIR